ncbi:MAG: hypothetical protein KDD40_06740, partial [Bdellovibrionales bacterium]|nr:hypothetical protein [Bdellovibrionales bacterium]
MSYYTIHDKNSYLRILNQINLDRNSSSCGSVDRSYWGWKKKDFSDITLQFAIMPLLKKHVSEIDIKTIFQKVMDFTLKNIWADGTCDQSYPHEKHPKTFLDIVPLFVTMIEDFPHFFTEKELAKARSILKKGVLYSLKYPESYAVISNHIAHDAY